MKPETRQILSGFDEPGTYEFPTGYDYEALERRAKLVCLDIHNFGVQVGFEGAEHNQDASFSIAIPLRSFERRDVNAIYQPTIRFSNFGSLATMTWIDQIPDAVQVEIRRLLAKHGFIYICADELDCVYDGVMADKTETFRTWWIRYFDWL